jgi:anti-sigma B factor antagonist
MTTSTSNEAAFTARSGHPRTPVDNFYMQEKWIGATVVLALKGDLDTLTAPSLTRAIDAAVNQRPSALIVDMADLDFLASAGMTALVMAQQQVGESMRLAVVADGPTTSRPLKVVGLDSVLSLYPSLDEALNGLSLS